LNLEYINVLFSINLKTNQKLNSFLIYRKKITGRATYHSKLQSIRNIKKIITLLSTQKIDIYYNEENTNILLVQEKETKKDYWMLMERAGGFGDGEKEKVR